MTWERMKRKRACSLSILEFVELIEGSHLLQAALSQLPLGDLNALLRYICQYMPMGPPGAVPPTGPPLTDGTTTDVVRCTS